MLRTAKTSKNYPKGGGEAVNRMVKIGEMSDVRRETLDVRLETRTWNIFAR
jgi:hypothetical protein